VAIFDYQNDVPGEIIWPENGEPKFVVPGHGSYGGWCDFSVMWMPRSWSFVAAVEQFYDPPDCDPVSFDGGSWQSEHTWHFVDGVWARPEPGANLMLRVQAEIIGAVVPASLGRVKALYR
jgi:hypothetical protein